MSEASRRASRAWVVRNPERAKLSNARYRSSPEGKAKIWARKLSQYGLTPETWTARFEAQGRCCAVCRTSERPSKGWHVDHDHRTGTVRGILCNLCNTGIGALGDTFEDVQRAAGYLGGVAAEAVEEHW